MIRCMKYTQTLKQTVYNFITNDLLFTMFVSHYFICTASYLRSGSQNLGEYSIVQRRRLDEYPIVIAHMAITY